MSDFCFMDDRCNNVGFNVIATRSFAVTWLHVLWLKLNKDASRGTYRKNLKFNIIMVTRRLSVGCFLLLLFDKNKVLGPVVDHCSILDRGESKQAILSTSLVAPIQIHKVLLFS